MVLGKPSEDFFATGVAELGLTANRVAMVGDDVENDVLAAQRCGLRGVLVRTGKFRPEALDRASGRPDHVVDSFSEVPELIPDCKLGFRWARLENSGQSSAREAGMDSRVMRPPSTVITWPVTKPASGVASHNTAAATSAGSPIRPTGCKDARSETAWA
ncbi:MAG: hypothetical protein Ct9H300mP12_08210 [Acidimicrobiales bacterium]|nr:MAG: hypothetical protein Ct9H300mP12_08210 [Acidimicrobiales bacterium]